MDTVLQEKRKKRIFILGIILYLMVTIFLTYITNSNIMVFFIGTLPILFSLISLSILIEMSYFNSWYFLGIPLIWGGLFYTIWAAKIIPIINKMNGSTIAVLDILFTYVIFMIIALFWGNKIRREKPTIIIKEKKVEEKDNKDIKNQQLLHNTKEEAYLRKEAELMAEKEQSEYEKEHYKKLATDYYNKLNILSQTLNLKNSDLEKYKEIAETYNKHIESNKAEKEKYEKLARTYSKQIKEDIGKIKEQRRQILNNSKLKNDIAQYEDLNSSLRNKVIFLNQRLKDAENALRVTKENFTSSLRSIEDKCKAINFVIGRVYSDKKGGSPKIRDMLKINRILYNAFSKITSEFKEKHVDVLKQILVLLQKKLGLLQLEEHKLFRLKKNPKIAIKRNTEGKSTILDVLVENDEDPVFEYYAEANEICINMLKFLEDNY